jgi:hypothetical protein
MVPITDRDQQAIKFICHTHLNTCCIFPLWSVDLALIDCGLAELAFHCEMYGLAQVRIECSLVKRVMVCMKSMKRSNLCRKQPK